MDPDKGEGDHPLQLVPEVDKSKAKQELESKAASVIIGEVYRGTVVSWSSNLWLYLYLICVSFGTWALEK